MATLTIDQAAQYASQQSGVPFALVKALIQAEGSWGSGDWTNGSIKNNPFDVTAEWAQLAGYGGYVTGQGGTQGNIASFSDPTAAVAAWAKGILTFSNYAKFRADLPGKNVTTLATDLANAGYAGPGNVMSWVNNVVGIVGNLGGIVITPKPIPVGSPDLPPIGGITGGATVGIGAAPQIITNITSQVPTSVEQGIGEVGAALASGFSAQTKAVADLVTGGENYVNAVVLVFERFLWILLGLILVLAGIWVLVQSQNPLAKLAESQVVGRAAEA